MSGERVRLGQGGKTGEQQAEKAGTSSRLGKGGVGRDKQLGKTSDGAGRMAGQAVGKQGRGKAGQDPRWTEVGNGQV